MNRDEARAAGQKHYDSAAPCKHGHAPRRYVSNQQCVECAFLQEVKQRALRPEAGRERRKAWLARNPEKAKQYELNRKLADPDRLRRKSRRAGWKFRKMPVPTRQMPETCECCGRPQNRIQNGRPHNLHLDHCHATNKFRGWLCNACNLGIGKLGDTVESVSRALAYLRKFEDSNGHDDSKDDRRHADGSPPDPQ